MEITVRRLLEYVGTHDGVSLDDVIYIHSTGERKVSAEMIGRVPGAGIVLANVGPVVAQ